MAMRRALVAQGVYYLATGVAPFISRSRFEAATGPKTEWWLVQTVGGLVGVIGAGLLSGARTGRATPELIWIAAGSATVLGTIDVIHVARRRISPTYLLDAAAQAALLAACARSRGT
jgi:hypothetical protein